MDDSNNDSNVKERMKIDDKYDEAEFADEYGRQHQILEQMKKKADDD